MSTRRDLVNRLADAKERIKTLEYEKEVIRETKHFYKDQMLDHAREIDALGKTIKWILSIVDNPCLCGGTEQHRCQSRSQTIKRELRERFTEGEIKWLKAEQKLKSS